MKASGWGQDDQGGEETELTQEITCSLQYFMSWVKAVCMNFRNVWIVLGGELCMHFMLFFKVLVPCRDRRGHNRIVKMRE